MPEKTIEERVLALEINIELMQRQLDNFQAAFENLGSLLVSVRDLLEKSTKFKGA